MPSPINPKKPDRYCPICEHKIPPRGFTCLKHRGYTKAELKLMEERLNAVD